MELLAGFTLLQIAVALASGLAAAFVRGLAGFGMAILLVPVLALALTPVQDACEVLLHRLATLLEHEALSGDALLPLAALVGTRRAWLRWGAGPRAGQALLLGAKATALLDGRAVPSLDDVRQVALPVLRHFKARIDPRRYNGAALLGLRGLVFKSHGSADAFAFEHALSRAYDAARNRLLDRVHDRILETLAALPMPDDEPGAATRAA